MWSFLFYNKVNIYNVKNKKDLNKYMIIYGYNIL